tara:strand:+ start:1021 stop:1653 length:633 start_codon:yes stop_codon:yes gene_type:complete
MRDYLYCKYSSTLDKNFLKRTPPTHIDEGTVTLDVLKPNSEEEFYNLLRANGIPINNIRIVLDRKSKEHRYVLANYSGRGVLYSYQAAIQAYLIAISKIYLAKITSPEIFKTIDYRPEWYEYECFIIYTFKPTLSPGKEEEYRSLDALVEAIKNSVDLNDVYQLLNSNDPIVDVIVDEMFETAKVIDDPGYHEELTDSLFREKGIGMEID